MARRVLYEPILKKGTHLAESKDVDGAYRGVQLNDENNQLDGNANFRKVEIEERRGLNAEECQAIADIAIAALPYVYKAATKLARFAKKEYTEELKPWIKEKATEMAEKRDARRIARQEKKSSKKEHYEEYGENVISFAESVQSIKESSSDISAEA